MKNKIKKLKKRLNQQIRKHLPHLITFTAFFLVTLAIYEAPKIKRDMLRDYVSSKVVRITNFDNNTGGTGFFINLPSGKVGILTNAHICELSKEFPLFVKLDEGRAVPVRIIEISKETDLCLIDSYGATKGLSVGENVEPGEKLYSVGHPALLPTSMTEGEATGEGEIELIHHVLEAGQECDTNQIKRSINILFFTVDACVEKFQVNFTTVPSFPGNSGSPLVDKYARVRGICFAGDTRINWSIILKAEAIQQFIQPY